MKNQQKNLFQQETQDSYLKQLLKNFSRLREQAEISQAHIESRLILGPGWVERFESGETIPSLDLLLAMLHIIEKRFSDLLDGLPDYPDAAEIERFIYAEQDRKDLVIHFKYSNFDAKYVLPNAKLEEFEQVIKTLRDGLSKLVQDNANAEAIKTKAITSSFKTAVELWSQANPSDLWYFIIYRAYCDPFNHPAQFARLDFSQSWKRAGGWALEEIFVDHYNLFLEKHGITLLIANNEDREHFAKTLEVTTRLETDKMDILLLGIVKNESGDDEQIMFGVIHIKASLAERRTDDVPMSEALIKAGYVSPLLTMDCKSTPSSEPHNRGELGAIVDTDSGKDKRSAKRKDVEDEASFSACFSYNANTRPTPADQKSNARIYTCNFNNPNDDFSKFIIGSWKAFLARRK